MGWGEKERARLKEQQPRMEASDPGTPDPCYVHLLIPASLGSRLGESVGGSSLGGGGVRILVSAGSSGPPSSRRLEFSAKLRPLLPAKASS